MRSAKAPRRVLFFVTLIAAGSLADPGLAQDISINLGQGNGGVTERAVQLIALLTILSIAPSILIMMTSFTRIVVVLSLLRTALGTATAPPNSVIIALAMFLTAFVSLFVRVIEPGKFSVIHLLSLWTMLQVPLIVLRARQHDWKRHRRAVRGMVIGALLIAGFFTFPFGRMLGQWLLG